MLICQCFSDVGINGGIVVWVCILCDVFLMVSSWLWCVLFDLDLFDTDGLVALNVVIEVVVDILVIVFIGCYE